MGKRITIGFRYFWKGFNPVDNLFTRLLRENYDVVITDEPEFLFFSTFKDGQTRIIPEIEKTCTRIFYTAENCRPDLSKCEWAFSFDYDDFVGNPRHYRLPLYTYWGAGENLIKPPNFAESVMGQKRLFCNFLYSKDAEPRVSFFKKLSRYKKIDSPGCSMNTTIPLIDNIFLRNMAIIERRVTGKSFFGSLYSRHFTRINQSKLAFLKKYKFTIAFENSSFNGYTTEKIYHPMLAGSIPIYWGNPLVERDFNPKSFVNAHDFSHDDVLIERIIELDQSASLYKKHLEEPWLKDNKPTGCMDLTRLTQQLNKIFG